MDTTSMNIHVLKKEYEGVTAGLRLEMGSAG